MGINIVVTNNEMQSAYRERIAKSLIETAPKFKWDDLVANPEFNPFTNKKQKMKLMNKLSALLLVAVLFTACKKDKIEHSSDFDRSYNAWTNFKAESGNSYTYQVSTSSWTNFQTFTLITVTDGKVTGRSYTARSTSQPPASAVTIHEEWQEELQTLNTHESGAPALTLDDIYDRAKNVWLKKKSDVAYYFETENNGMISTCGFVPDGCQDDCFTGIHIDFIRKVEE